MHINELIGSKVWVKENSCPEYSGVIAAILDPYESEDIEEAVNLTQFAVQLSGQSRKRVNSIQRFSV